MIELNPRHNAFSALNYIIGDFQRVPWGTPVCDRPGPYTGNRTLQVNQGGLQNREVSTDCKEKFRREVSPWLSESANISEKFTGKIELHLLDGSLKKAFLHPKI
jgi:hypothetical protein